MKNIPLTFLLCSIMSLFGLLTSCNEDINDEYVDNFFCKMDTGAEYIIVVGDIQEYTQQKDRCKKYLVPSMNWVRSMAKHGYRINSVIQTGDITNNNESWQYTNFMKSSRGLAGELLYVCVTGNHDYDWDENQQISDRNSSRFSQDARFLSLNRQIVAQYEKEKWDNIVVRHYIHGKRYDILCLEFAPRPDVVEWARQYVSSHPYHQFILLTHEFLDGKEGLISDENTHARRQFVNKSLSCTPQEVWDRLIRSNDNIRCVLCGHRGFSQFYDNHINDAGRRVPQVLFNLQDVEHGGNGFLEVWEIPQKIDSVHVKVYDTLHNIVFNDSISPAVNAKHTQFSFSL